jgi:hypothetical protein
MLDLVNLFQAAECAIREDGERIRTTLAQNLQECRLNLFGVVRENGLRDFAGHVMLRPTGRIAAHTWLKPMWPEMSFCVGLHVVLTARGTVTSCIPITVSLLLSLFPFFLGFNGRCGLHTANLSMLNLGTVQLFSRL